MHCNYEETPHTLPDKTQLAWAVSLQYMRQTRCHVSAGTHTHTGDGRRSIPLVGRGHRRCDFGAGGIELLRLDIPHGHRWLHFLLGHEQDGAGAEDYGGENREYDSDCGTTIAAVRLLVQLLDSNIEVERDWRIGVGARIHPRRRREKWREVERGAR